MKIVIDSNIFIKDRHMLTTSFKQLLELDLTKYTIYIPQLVYDEVMNKHNEQLIEKKDKVEKAIDNFNRVTNQDFSQPITDAYIQEKNEEYKNSLDKKLADVNTKILEYPEISHQKIVQRALERKKPFDKDGKEGYRDTLIWETILKLAKSKPTESIAFISNNSSDFANNSKNNLHTDLLDELNDACSEVRYFSTLENFIETIDDPKLKIIDDVQELLDITGNHLEEKQQ